MSKEREGFEGCYKTSRDYRFYVKHEMSEKQIFEFKNGRYVVDCVNDAWKIWQAAKAQAVPECTWKQNEDGYFDASCGQSFVFSETDDTPSSHEFTHCCFCGGQLIEAQEPSSTPGCSDEP